VTDPVSATVSRLVSSTVAVAILVFAAATFLLPPRAGIGGESGAFAIGLAFWTGLTLIASALPVRLPRGTVASVSVAPILATIALGGPAAAAIVGFIGTTDSREARGQVPWYGTLFNHAVIVIAAVIAGFVYEGVRRTVGDAHDVASGAILFLGLMASAVIYYLINGVLAVAAVSARTSVAFRTIWAQDVRGIAPNLVGLAPLGWLMAQIFTLPNNVGWWATPLFVVPLFTTRLAYHRFVETRELFEQTIGALANAVDARDKYTRGHSNRVSFISEAMCRVMRLPEADIERIKWAGLLHDVGKIGIRDNILLKEGPLDREERITMNQHPIIGAEIVEPAKQLSSEAPLIRAHHEWFNGSGYPDGVEAFDIPLGARILTIADAYEAMTSSRPYRKVALSHEIAVAELEKFSGIQFDPDIVPVLVGLDREILDRPPDRPDELPTMLHSSDPREREEPSEADDHAAAATAVTQPPTGTQEGSPPSRPQLASDDVS
jgi:putative nucleotidyltransferase with HDIG domain